MSILQFAPNQLFTEDSDSDSDCEDEIMHKKEHEQRQLSVLQKHDAAAYDAWIEVSHQYRLLEQHCHLQDIQIQNLTHQNELLSKINTDLTFDHSRLIQDVMMVQESYTLLKQENTGLVDQLLDYENENQTLIGELLTIQQKLTDGVDTNTMLIHIQEILTKQAINKHGYV